MRDYGTSCGVRAIRPYHLYFFDAHHYLGSGSLEADSDFSAVRRARDLGGNAAVELWQGRRKVVSLPGADRKLLNPPRDYPTPA